MLQVIAIVILLGIVILILATEDGRGFVSEVVLKGCVGGCLEVIMMGIIFALPFILLGVLLFLIAAAFGAFNR